MPAFRSVSDSVAEEGHIGVDSVREGRGQLATSRAHVALHFQYRPLLARSGHGLGKLVRFAQVGVDLLGGGKRAITFDPGSAGLEMK